MAVLARSLSLEVPPHQLSFLRFLVGTVVMATYFGATRQAPDLRHKSRLLLRGLFGTGAVLAYFTAISRLGAGPATVLNYCSPIAAAVFAAVFLKEQPTGMTRLGLLFATLGAALVSAATGEIRFGELPGFGILAGVASSIFGGAAITVIRSLRHDTNAQTVFSAFSVVGLLCTAPLASRSWVQLDARLWTLGIVMGLLSVCGQFLFTLGMGFTTATAGSATTQLVPVLSWVLSVSVLGEPVKALSLSGALLCVGGVLVGAVQNARVRTPSSSGFR
jgi:drug/metabolite transporter (DMT)-like permease